MLCPFFGKDAVDILVNTSVDEPKHSQAVDLYFEVAEHGLV